METISSLEKYFCPISKASILEALVKSGYREYRADYIKEISGVSHAETYKQLDELAEDGVVEKRKDGKHENSPSFYKLNPKDEFLQGLTEIYHNLPESMNLTDYFRNRNATRILEFLLGAEERKLGYTTEEIIKQAGIGNASAYRNVKYLFNKGILAKNQQFYSLNKDDKFLMALKILYEKTKRKHSRRN